MSSPLQSDFLGLEDLAASSQPVDPAGADVPFEPLEADATSAQRRRHAERTATPPADAAFVAGRTSDEFDVSQPEPPPTSADLVGTFLEGAAERKSPEEKVLEQLGVGAKATAGGAVLSSGVIPATAAGAAAGAKLGTPGGPTGQKIGAGVGGIVGFFGGLYSGYRAAEEAEAAGLVIVDPMKLPPEQRAMAQAGLSAGASLTGTGTTSFLALSGLRLAPNMTGDFVNKLLTHAREKPGAFLLLEGTSATSAAAGAAWAEIMYPGNTFASTGAEMAAGALNPLQAFARFSRFAYSKTIQPFIARLTDEGKLTAAGRALQEFVSHTAAGDDITDPTQSMQTFMQAVRDAREQRVGLDPNIKFDEGTAGQLTGNERIAKFEAELARHDENFYGRLQTEANETRKDLVYLLELMRQTGDPNALKSVAEMRAAHYFGLLDRKLAQAQETAVLATEKAMKGGEPVTTAKRSEISLAAVDTYEQVLGRVRALQDGLWKDAFPNQQTTLNPKNIFKMYGELTGSLAPGRKLPSEIEDTISTMTEALNLLNRADGGTDITPDRIAWAKEQLSIRKMQGFRSELLGLARDASRGRIARSSQDERRFGQMAEAILDDMVALGLATKATALGRRGAGGKFVPDDATTALDAALEFTRQTANAFERSFPASLRASGPFGQRVPPEAFLSKMIGGDDISSAVRVRDLQDTVKHPKIRALLDPEQQRDFDLNANLMYDLNSRFMRTFIDSITETVVDTVTGKEFAQLNLSKARQFLKDNDELLDVYQHVKDDLTAAVKNQASFERYANEVNGLKKEVNDGLLGKLIGAPSVPEHIGGILRSNDPAGKMREIAKLAIANGAEESLSAAIWDYVFFKSNPDSPQSIIDILRIPPRAGTPSLLDLMKENNLIPPEHVAKIDTAVDMLGKLDAAGAVRGTGEQILPVLHTLEGVIVRGIGAYAARTGLRIGTKLIGGEAGGTGPTLIVSGRGAQAAADMFQRGPLVGVERLLVNALSGAPLKPGGEPFSLLEHMMQTPTTAKEMHEQILRLHTYMWQAGLLGAIDEYHNEAPLDTPFALKDFQTESGEPEVPIAGLSQPRYKVLGTPKFDLRPQSVPGQPDPEAGVLPEPEAGILTEPEAGGLTVSPDGAAAPSPGNFLGLEETPNAPQDIEEKEEFEVDDTLSEGGGLIERGLNAVGNFFAGNRAGSDLGQQSLDALNQPIPGENILQQQERDAEGGPAPTGEGIVAQLKQFENNVREGFDEATGRWTPHPSVEGGRDTIAYGHKLTAEEEKSGVISINGQDVEIAAGLTEEQADILLRQDIQIARRQVDNFLPLAEQVPQAVEDILVQMAFQMGGGSLRGFTDLRKALVTFPPDYNAAADAMLDSKWAREDSPERAQALATQMRTFGEVADEGAAE